MVVCVGGGWGWWELVAFSAWFVSVPVPGEGRGQMVWGWHCWWRGGGAVGAVLVGSLGIPPGPVGVACACCAFLTVPG